MKINPLQLLKVYLIFSEKKKFFVGRLALKDQQIWFEYDKEFLQENLEISPFKLPLGPKPLSSKEQIFSGLHGVFNDSLPDSWGQLLVDRKLRNSGIDPGNLSALDRLSIVAQHGMGALSYEPEQTIYDYKHEKLDLDNLYKSSLEILQDSRSESIDELFSFSGSIGGARPKITVLVNKDRKKILHSRTEKIKHNDYEHWLIKFSANQDLSDLGLIEYAYSLMAKKANIEMSDTYLFNTKKSNYFGTKRFDRNGDKRLHIHSSSGLLHSDYRYPSLDYENLFKATLLLTKDANELSKLYRITVFNVLAHNRDDHSKNFSFLMDEQGTWKLSPAYDLTYSNGPGGEHSMMVCGEGKNPGIEELTKLAKKFSIKNYQEIIEATKDAVSQWKNIGKDIGVSKDSIKLISGKLLYN